MSGDPSDPGYAHSLVIPAPLIPGTTLFDSGFTIPANDLWGAAAGLGSADNIPSGNYQTTSAFSLANDNLSFVFAGLPTNGDWVLTITDYYPPTTSFVPGISSWDLTIQATSLAAGTPEPHTALPVAFCFGLLWFVRRLN
jgi:hypothetical protein